MLPSHRDSPATDRGDHDWQHSLTLYLMYGAFERSAVRQEPNADRRRHEASV
jgi:hypothetical protein